MVPFMSLHNMLSTMNALSEIRSSSSFSDFSIAAAAFFVRLQLRIQLGFLFLP